MGVTWEVINTVDVLAGSVKSVSLEEGPLALVILEVSRVILMDVGLRTTSLEGWWICVS